MHSTFYTFFSKKTNDLGADLVLFYNLVKSFHLFLSICQYRQCKRLFNNKRYSLAVIEDIIFKLKFI